MFFYRVGCFAVIYLSCWLGVKKAVVSPSFTPSLLLLTFLSILSANLERGAGLTKTENPHSRSTYNSQGRFFVSEKFLTQKFMLGLGSGDDIDALHEPNSAATSCAHVSRLFRVPFSQLIRHTHAACGKVTGKRSHVTVLNYFGNQHL